MRQLLLSVILGIVLMTGFLAGLPTGADICEDEGGQEAAPKENGWPRA